MSDGPSPKFTFSNAMSAIAILLSALGLAWTGGVISGQVQSQGIRVTNLERKVDEQSLIVTRIDANVTFLADRAREDRAIFDQRRTGK